MIKLKNTEELESLKQGQSILLFSADWCPDCRFIEPFLDDIENEFPSYQLVYVDRDEFLDVCVEHNVMGIPSFIVYDQGDIKGTFISKLRKTKQEIFDFLHKTIK